LRQIKIKGPNWD